MVDYHISTTTAPLRFEFKLAANFAAAGTITVTLPANELDYDTTATPRCYFKTTTDGRFYTMEYAESCQFSGNIGSGFTFVATTKSVLNAADTHQLIVMSDGQSYSNFQALTSKKEIQVKFEDSSPSLVHAETLTVYEYQATSFTPTNIYFTSTEEGESNHIIIKGTLDSAISAFPDSTVEWEFENRFNGFTDVPFATAPADKSQVTCGYTGFSSRGAQFNAPFCVSIQGASASLTPGKISFENYDAVTASTNVEFYLYDIENPTGSITLPVLTLRIVDGNDLYYYKIWNPIKPTAGVIVEASSTADYPTPAPLTHSATVTSLTFPSIAWDAAEACTAGASSNCILMLDYKNVPYPLTASTMFKVGATDQTKIGTDLVNSRLCKFN